jgi:hypothetical protein
MSTDNLSEINEPHQANDSVGAALVAAVYDQLEVQKTPAPAGNALKSVNDILRGFQLEGLSKHNELRTQPVYDNLGTLVQDTLTAVQEQDKTYNSKHPSDKANPEQQKNPEFREDNKTEIEEKNLAEFKKSWTEAITAEKDSKDAPTKGLKREIVDLLEEIGEQIGKGKLDAEAIQKRLEAIKFSTEGPEYTAAFKRLKVFSDDIAREYGVELKFSYEVKGNQISISEVRLGQTHTKDSKLASVDIPKVGDPSAQEVPPGSTKIPDSATVPVEIAMQKLNKQAAQGKRDLKK